MTTRPHVSTVAEVGDFLRAEIAARETFHGCVRLEKPVEFANFVLEEPKFDEGFYNRCLIDQKPSTFKLPRPFPVFVVYNLADVNEAGQLQFYRDVYTWDK